MSNDTLQRTHAPDFPFGCPKTWGEPVLFADMGLHVCNRIEGHDGQHDCVCGAWEKNE